MKKRISLLAVLALMISMFTINAFAANPKLSMTSSNETVTSNSKFTVTVAAPVATATKGMDLYVVFDSTVFDFVADESTCPADSNNGGAWMLSDMVLQGDNKTIKWMGVSPMGAVSIGEGEALLKLVFTVKDGADAGEYVFTSNIYNGNGTTVVLDPADTLTVNIPKTIKPADFTLPDTSVNYNGEEQEPKFTLNNGVTDADFDVVYSTTNGSLKNNKPFGVGTYTVKFVGKVGGEAVFENAFTIAKAPLTIKAKDMTKTYGKDDPMEYTVTNGTLYGNDTLTGIFAREVGEDAGDYKITGLGTVGNPNYTVTYDSTSNAKLTITAKVMNSGAVTVKPDNADNSYSYPITAENVWKLFGFNSAEEAVNIEFTIKYSVDSVTWTEDVPTKAGTYFCKINTTSALGNYEGEVVVKVTIKGNRPPQSGKPGSVSNFVDIDARAYYYDAVEWAVANGITEGKTYFKFAPNEACTRAQMVTFLWRAAGCPTPSGSYSKFVDVNMNKYYADAVLWAVENGITEGKTATTFAPNQACTRAQMATFLYRFAKGSANGNASGFSDVSSSKYYAPAVAWAVQNGITNGTTATTFSPNNVCTRAQMVTFLYRYFEA